MWFIPIIIYVVLLTPIVWIVVVESYLRDFGGMFSLLIDLHNSYLTSLSAGTIYS